MPHELLGKDCIVERRKKICVAAEKNNAEVFNPNGQPELALSQLREQSVSSLQIYTVWALARTWGGHVDPGCSPKKQPVEYIYLNVV